MGVAERMLAVELEIGFPMIVYQDAGKMRQHALGDHGLRAPFGMGMIKRPLRIGHAMQPMRFAGNVDAGLIAMQHAGMDELGDQFLFERRQ